MSSASSKTNVSQSSQQKNVYLVQTQSYQSEAPVLAQDSNKLSFAKLELTIPATLDIINTQPDFTFISQRSSPQAIDETFPLPKQSETSGMAEYQAMTQEFQESSNVLSRKSSNSTLTPPGSGSPELDQLLTDLKEMKLKFTPEILDSPLSEPSSNSPEDEKAYMYEELSPEDQSPTENSETWVSLSCAANTSTNEADTPDVRRTCKSNLDSHEDSYVCIMSPTEPFSAPKIPHNLNEEIEPSPNSGMSLSYTEAETGAETLSLEADTPESKQTTLCGEELTSSTHINPEEPCLPPQPDDSMDLTEETSTESNQDALLFDKTFTGSFSSPSVSNLIIERVASARHLSFTKLIPYNSSQSLEIPSDKDSPGICKEHSEGNLIPVDHQCFASQLPSFQLKTDTTSSTSDEEYNIQLGDAETSDSDVHTPPGSTNVRYRGAYSPNFEYSDPEPYFDCKQGVSDFSEPELNETETTTASSGGQAQGQLNHLGTKKKPTQKVLLSSGSEDYEDAPLLLEPHCVVHEDSEESQHYSETSEEEFTMCKESQLPGTYDTVKSLRRVR